MNHTSKYKLVPMIAINKDEATFDNMQDELLKLLKAKNMTSQEKRMLYEDLLKRVHNFNLDKDDVFPKSVVSGEPEHISAPHRRQTRAPRAVPKVQQAPPPPPVAQAATAATQVVPAVVGPPMAPAPVVKSVEKQRRIGKSGKVQKRPKPVKNVPAHRPHRLQNLQGMPAVPALPQGPAVPVAFVPPPPAAPAAPAAPRRRRVQPQLPPPTRPAKRAAPGDIGLVRFAPGRPQVPPAYAVHQPTYPPPPPRRKRVRDAPIGRPPRPVRVIRNLTTRKRATVHDTLPRARGETTSKHRQIGGARLRVQSWR